MFKRTLTLQMLFVLMPAKYILTTENKKHPFGGNRGRHSRTNKQEQKLSYMYEPGMILFRRLNKGITSEQKAIKRMSPLICEFFFALSHELQSLITTTESNRQLKLTGIHATKFGSVFKYSNSLSVFSTFTLSKQNLFCFRYLHLALSSLFVYIRLSFL